MKSTYQLGLACSAALAALVAIPSLSFGQLPVSRTAAALPTAITGAATTSIGIPFIRDAAVRDVVSASGAGSITGSTTYTAGAFNNTHSVLIVTGPSRGTSLPITSNTATTLTVSGTVPALVNNSDEFDIVPLNTLSSLFGTPPVDLAGGATAAAADKVILNGIRYFYKSSAPTGWRLENLPFGADQGGAVIGDLRGATIVRLGAATNVLVRGNIRSTRAVISIPNGTSLQSWPYPGNVTLSSSALQTSITGAATAAAADKVIIGSTRYFFKTSAPSGWRLENLPFGADQGGVVLNAGNKAFVIIRLGAATGHPVLETFVP